jgi:aspartyl-tRNA(Asn)/glutamyl-tRNA(Gln) amidotransferase subunit A
LTSEEGIARGRSFAARLSAREIVRLTARRQLGVAEVAQALLDDAAQIGPLLNCFCALDPDHVLVQARRVQALVDAGTAGPLCGVPIPVKDLIATRDYPTAFGSRPFRDNRAAADAPSVERMLAGGALLFGKTTTSELGCKATGSSPLTGITRNPWNPALTPGGSSAGSAAAVAAGLAPVALGTDGGGSVRIPAALTGLVGFKATFGRVPVYPVSATPTLGHVGVLARDVRDAALVIDAISGYDARDPFAPPLPAISGLAACERAPGRPRVAFSATLGYARPDPDVLRRVEEGVRDLEALGCEVTPVAEVFDDPAHIWESEFYTDVATRLADLSPQSRAELDADVAARLDAHMGRSLLHHRQLALRRFALRGAVRALFERFDFLVTPTLPVVAFPVERTSPRGYRADDLVCWASYTYPFNLTGNPAVSLPVGLSNGLPAGMQIVGRPFEDEALFAIAAAFEATRPSPLLVS